MTKLLMCTAVFALIAGGAWVWYAKPWIKEPPSLEPADFTRQMNELLGANEESKRNAAAIEQAVAAIRADVNAIEERAIADPDPQAMLADDFPSNAVGLVLGEPPKSVGAARAFAQELEASGHFAMLCRALAGEPACNPWLPDVPVGEQFGARISGPSERPSVRWLLARMRLAAIDGQGELSIESFEALVRLSRNRLQRLLLIDALIGAAYAQQSTQELRLQILEHALGEPELLRADQMLAAGYPDWSTLCEYSERLLRGEGLYSLAVSKTALDDTEIPNTKENRRKFHDAGLAQQVELRSVLCAQPLRPDPKDPPSLMDGMNEILHPSGDITKSIAASNSMVMSGAYAIRRMVATVQGTRVMIAIERARRRSGSLPRVLDEIPHDLRGTPPVEFTAIGYVPRENGSFLLYAFGPDGVDNAGRIIESSLGDTRAGSDIMLSETRRELTERQERRSKEADALSSPETPPTPDPDE